MTTKSATLTLAATVLWLGHAGCYVEVTRIGSIDVAGDGSVEGEDGSLPDATVNDTPALRKWVAVTQAAGPKHLRGSWTAGGDDLWTLGIVSAEPDASVGDVTGSVDAGPGPLISGSVMRRTSDKWSTLLLPTVVNALWGASAGAVWAVGTNAIYKTDATSHSAYRPSSWTELNAVWGARGDDVWAGGTTLMHWNGSVWTQSSLVGPTDRVGSISGTAKNDVWAVSDAGNIRHWDGVIWSAAPSGVAFALRGVWAADAKNAWTVGDAGTVLYWNGSTWSAVDAKTSANLWAVWGSSSADVWMVGESGTILHFDGATISKADTPTSSDLSSVWGGPGGASVWAVGDSALLHYVQ